MFAWLSTLTGDLWGKSRTERSYREDGKLSCPALMPASRAAQWVQVAGLRSGPSVRKQRRPRA